MNADDTPASFFTAGETMSTPARKLPELDYISPSVARPPSRLMGHSTEMLAVEIDNTGRENGVGYGTAMGTQEITDPKPPEQEIKSEDMEQPKPRPKKRKQPTEGPPNERAKKQKTAPETLTLPVRPSTQSSQPQKIRFTSASPEPMPKDTSEPAPLPSQPTPSVPDSEASSSDDEAPEQLTATAAKTALTALTARAKHAISEKAAEDAEKQRRRAERLRKRDEEADKKRRKKELKQKRSEARDRKAGGGENANAAEGPDLLPEGLLEQLQAETDRSEEVADFNLPIRTSGRAGLPQPKKITFDQTGQQLAPLPSALKPPRDKYKDGVRIRVLQEKDTRFAPPADRQSVKLKAQWLAQAGRRMKHHVGREVAGGKPFVREARKWREGPSRREKKKARRAEAARLAAEGSD